MAGHNTHLPTKQSRCNHADSGGFISRQAGRGAFHAGGETSSGICSLNALDEKEIPGCPELLRTVLQGQGAKVVAARSYSLPLKQSLERRRRSMVTLRPSRHMSGFGGDHVS